MQVLSDTPCIRQVCPQGDDQALLDRLWSYEPIVPEWDIKASVNSAGQIQRIRIALDKMLQGQHIKIAVIGGSPSAGLGAASPPEGYLQIFKSWIVSMFPEQPPEVVEHTMAKASGAVAMRCSAMQEDDADIIIVELNHDDVHSNKDAESVPGAVCVFQSSQMWLRVFRLVVMVFLMEALCRDYDRLLRRSLLLPNRPGVILLSAATINFDDSELTLFHRIPENDKLVLGQFYGVPLISLRGATYHHAQNNFMSAQLNATEPESAEAKRLAKRVRLDLGPERYHRYCPLVSFPLC